MVEYLKDLAIGGLTLAVLDAPFLKFIMTLYRPMMANITNSPLNIDMSLTRNLLSFVVAYFLMSLALKELATSDQKAIITGLTIYGIYSFTLMVLFQKWDPKVALIETIWGAILYFVARRTVSYIKTIL